MSYIVILISFQTFSSINCGSTYIQFDEICSLSQGTQSGNKCKVGHQTLSYVKILREADLSIERNRHTYERQFGFEMMPN